MSVSMFRLAPHGSLVIGVFVAALVGLVNGTALAHPFKRLAASAVAPRPPALVRVSSKSAISYYDVYGTTMESLRSEITGANSWPADTRWSVTWTYRLRQRLGSCSIVSATVNLNVLYTMPRWFGERVAGPDIATAWNEFVAGVWSHEAGHAAIGRGARDAVTASLESVKPAPSCGRTGVRARAAARAALRPWMTRDAVYDAETSHGATQNAAL